MWDAIDRCIEVTENKIKKSDEQRELNQKKSQKVKKMDADKSIKLVIFISRKDCYCDLNGVPAIIEKKLKNYYTIRTKNIMGGCAIHMGIALMMEITAYLQFYFFKT